jgi:glyoxylase-like metal-dependent hydrolase (beta-lactamase superfamily II)
MAPPILLSANNPGPLTGSGNNTWLIDGDEPTLVDAGVGHPDHLRAIEAVLRGRALAHVLVTHGHSDHASGVPALRARWPQLIASKWPSTNPGSEPPCNDEGWRPLRDGERVRAGDADLLVIHTPGHSLDHVSFFDPVTRDLFAGDMVLAESTVLIPAGRGGNLRQYLASLERLRALAPARILPGHGPIVERPGERIAVYIAHRETREAEVRRCLADGVTDPDAIVARIYPGLAEAMRPAARLTILAHLEKLDEDPRAPR